MIPNDAAELVAATIRTLFARLDQAAVRSELGTVANSSAQDGRSVTPCSVSPAFTTSP
ncbi:hypothetical protein [Streptomyces sp. NPDC021608]|uniref:hypothetical protein n=1 Tax=Streptomyces sp. NPDC021608 TaxID=3154903 RepID=UPI0033FF51DD